MGQAAAELLLERLATLTERLTQLLDEENQGEIAGILAGLLGVGGGIDDLRPFAASEFIDALFEA